MLWYKAWTETRGRFLVCLALLLLPSYDFLVWKKVVFPGDIDGPSLYYKALFNNHVAASIIWVFAVILLGLGGLVRERAVGSSSLTVTLPVSRTRLVGIRVGVGFLEAVALAIVPWILNFGISVFRQRPFSLAQAVCCLVFLIGGGMVCFATAVLVSSILEGEYTAAAVAYGAVISSFFLSENVDRLKMIDIFSLVIGADYVDKQTFLFSGPLPWATILGSLTIAGLLVFSSILVIRHRDF